MPRNNFQLPGLQPNARYAIQIRGIDANGNPGRWSTSLEFETVQDLLAPAPIEGLTAISDGSNFIINWNHSTENEDGSPLEDLRDYRVTISAGADSAVFTTVDDSFLFNYTLNKNSFSAPQPALNVIVQARDRVGNLSSPVDVDVSKPAPGPASLAAIAKRNGVELVWTAVEDDLDRYEIWKNGSFYARIAPGTLIFTDTDVGTGAQQYQIRAYDRFEQFSESNSVTEAEISLDIQGDTIPPKPPTNPTYEELSMGQDVLVSVGWDAPVEDVDDTSYTDQEGFQLRYRKDLGRPWTYMDIADTRNEGTDPETFAVDLSIPQGGFLYWGVRAYDRSGNFSEWLSSTDAVSVDDTVPNRPSQPIVAGNLQTIQIRHDLRDEFGAPLPGNVQRLDIHISNDPNFTPSDTTRVGRASVNRLIRMGPVELVWSVPVEATEGDRERYIRVVAVTAFPQYSEPSVVVGPELIDLVQSIHIEDATITSAKIQSLDADKITAGSAFVNDLNIESRITVNADGSVESSNFDFANRTGWALDNGNFYLFDGEIDAGVITLQNEANLIDQGYSMFSYQEAWYSDNLHSSDTSLFATRTSVWSRYGPTALRIQTTATGTLYAWLSDSSFAKSIRVESDQSYIVSAYVRNNSSSTNSLAFAAWNSGAISAIGSPESFSPGQTKRISRVYSPGSEQFSLGFQTTENGVDFIVDGVQVELQTAGSTSPSAFKPGGITTISAGQLSTGTIDASVIDVINLNANNITAGFIDADLIESRSIVADKIAVGTITAESAVIADAAIQRAQIEDGAINRAKIQDGEIIRAKIGDAAIGRAQIEDAEITFAKISSAAINSLRAHTVSANNITAGTIDASVITVENLDAGNITTGFFSSTRISGEQLTLSGSGGSMSLQAGMSNTGESGITAGNLSNTFTLQRFVNILLGNSLERTVLHTQNHSHNTGTRTSSGASWFSGGTTGATGNPLVNTNNSRTGGASSTAQSHTHAFGHTHNVQDHTHTLFI